MKVTVAPDSFKGSLTAIEAAHITEKAIKYVIPDAKIDLKPMADGGEGTLDALINAMTGRIKEVACTGPLGNRINTQYGIIDNHTAVIEIAKICGLTLVPIEQRNPEKTTSFGVGEVIEDAINQGVKKMIIGLGGSATNDGGFGMLQALGLRAYDKNKELLNGFGEDLYKLDKLDWRHLDPRLKNISITVANDVNNPLCGENGASYIYGQQKGATNEQIKKLDQAIYEYAQKIELVQQINIQNQAGVGAAGGLGFALRVIGAELKPAAKLIADTIALESSLAVSDLVITGEGKSDEQTLNGKAPFYVSQLAHKYNKPVILISGSVDNSNRVLNKAFTSVFSILNAPMTVEEAMTNAKLLLYNQVVQVIATIKDGKE